MMHFADGMTGRSCAEFCCEFGLGCVGACKYIRAVPATT